MTYDCGGSWLFGYGTKFGMWARIGAGDAQGDRLMLDAQGTEILRADCQLGVMYLLTLAE